MSNTALYESDSENDIATPYNAGGELDSDDESLVDVDSPADGYFEHRGHPQETFVENPALRASEDKAREAAEERQSSSVAGGLLPEHSTPSRAPVWTDETAPLLDAGPPPPDYAAAIADRRVPQLQSQGQAQGPIRGGNYGSISSALPPQAPGHPSAASEPQREQPGVPASFGNDHPLVRNGLFGEQGVLGSRNEPQSMRDTPAQQQTSVAAVDQRTARDAEGDTDEESGLISRQPHKQSKKQWRRWRWYCCRPKSWLNWFLVFAVILAVILISRANMNADGSGNGKQKLPVHSPIKNPKVPIPDHPHSRQCAFDSYSERLSFDFSSPGNFSFMELIDIADYTHLLPNGATLSGTLKISPAPAKQDVDIRVWVSIAATRPWSVTAVRYVKDGDGLELKFPEVEQRAQHGLQGYESACLDIAVLVQVREGVTVQNWDISTANMDVVVESSLFASDNDDRMWTPPEQQAMEDGLIVRNETSFWAMKGSVSAAYWSSRRIRVSTLSGRITGTYALRDSLELESKSGAIKVGVEPKQEDKDHPAPADFSVKTLSGSVDVDFPSSDEDVVPEREYRTRVESQSSRISGRYLLGVTGTFTSYSGRLDLCILPYSSSRFNSTLHTSTFSGRTSINLLEAINAVPISKDVNYESPDPHYLGEWNVGSIHSTHKSLSGAINLVYPSSWVGMIDGRSISGHIKVKGKDVEIIKDVRGPGTRRVVAKKGVGDSKLVFKTTSGSVDVLVGEEY